MKMALPTNSSLLPLNMLLLQLVLLLLLLPTSFAAAADGRSVIVLSSPPPTTDGNNTTYSACARQLGELQNCSDSILRREDEQAFLTIPPTSPQEAYGLCQAAIQQTTLCAQSLLDEISGEGGNGGGQHRDKKGEPSNPLVPSSSSLSSSAAGEASVLACLPWKFNWEFCLNYEGDACSFECSDPIDQDGQEQASSSSTSSHSSYRNVIGHGGFHPDTSCAAFHGTVDRGMDCCPPCVHYIEAYEACVVSYQKCRDDDDYHDDHSEADDGSFSRLSHLLASPSISNVDRLIAQNRHYAAFGFLMLASPLVLFSFFRQVFALSYWRCHVSNRSRHSR